MRIAELERHRGEQFQVGDTLHVWNHKLRIVGRTPDALVLRIDANHSCRVNQLPADVAVEHRLELA